VVNFCIDNDLNGYIVSDSLLNLIPRLVTEQSNFIIGWRGETAVTRVEFIERVSSWRHLLEQLSGQHYALYLEDSIEFSAALFGAWYGGKTIWLAADSLQSSNNALKLTVDGFLGDFPADCASLYPSSALRSRVHEYDELDYQSVGLVVHTSGTTGAAQAIPKKMSQLAIEVAAIEQLFGKETANAEIISTVTHQHIYGLLFKVLWPLATGRAIHAHTQLFPEELIRLIASRSCALISSPAHLKRLPIHLNWAGQRLCAVFSSGGVLPAAVAQSTEKLLGQCPIEIFGSSETGGIGWRRRVTKTDDCWTPMPNVEWRISSADELMEVRSPHLLTEEWWQLSDRVEAQKNGRFILKGRCDRIVKIEEKRVSLDLIEQRIATSALVSEVKIVAFNDEADLSCELQRQHLAAVIVLSKLGKSLLFNQGKLALNQQLKNVLVNFVESVALPRKWRYVDQFPMNAAGKTPEALLRALFLHDNENVEQEGRKSLFPLVKLLTRDEKCVELELLWPVNLVYFEGHFPKTPILPGVVQVDWAIKAGRQFFDLPRQFCAMHTVKFQHVILPDSSVNLKLSYEQEKGWLSFSYFSPAKQHSSGRILFALSG